MRKLFLIIALLLACGAAHAQEIQPIQRGPLPQRAALHPYFGRLFWVTDSGVERPTYWNGIAWVDLLTSGSYCVGCGPTPTALTKTDDTNVTLTLGGSPATALLAATSLTLGWTGQLAIGRGGTGAATALAGFNALSPLTTRGDLLTRDATNNVRLAIGSAGKYVRSDGTDPSWQSITAAD